jgi:hypothetical protein
MKKSQIKLVCGAIAALLAVAAIYNYKSFISDITVLSKDSREKGSGIRR